VKRCADGVGVDREQILRLAILPALPLSLFFLAGLLAVLPLALVTLLPVLAVLPGLVVTVVPFLPRWALLLGAWLALKQTDLRAALRLGRVSCFWSCLPRPFKGK